MLVLAPWNDPIPMTRAWCLWEIYSTLVAGSQFEIVIAKAEVDGLRAAVLARADDALTKVMVDVDAKKAECFVPADRVQIVAAVDAMEGGFHRLDVEVKAMMRKWVLGVVRKLCADDGWTESAKQRALLCSQVGAVLSAYGEADLALEHLKKALAIRVAVLGTGHTDTAASYNNIGSVLKAKGDLDSAVEYMRKALAIQEAALGEQHPSTATSYNNIGSVLEVKGDLDGALGYYRKGLVIREATLGEQHPLTAASTTTFQFCCMPRATSTGRWSTCARAWLSTRR